jgi:hypothetical protein
LTWQREPLKDDWHEEALDDLNLLDDTDPKLGDAAIQAVDDLCHCRKVGKALGKRKTSGDLGGLLRLKFDLPGEYPERYRVVYEETEPGKAIYIWGMGQRESQWVYRMVQARQ